MASAPIPATRLPARQLDLEITIISAKHLKNVNWKNGDLKPYAVFWLDPGRRLSTKADSSGSIKPVWNEKFTLPLTLPVEDAVLTLEIFHSKPSETPKPFVGSLRFPLAQLADSDDSDQIRTLDLRRSSGRPHGKIRIKLALRERPLPDYPIAPQSNYYYSSAPPPPPRDYSGYSATPYASSPPVVPSPSPPPQSYPYGTYHDPYYYSNYYSAPPIPLPRPYSDRQYGSYSGPSAPVDYSPYDMKRKETSSGSSKAGLGTGAAVGAVAGSLGGLALEEGLKYEGEKSAERIESDVASRDGYGNYRVDY